MFHLWPVLANRESSYLLRGEKIDAHLPRLTLVDWIVRCDLFEDGSAIKSGISEAAVKGAADGF